MDVVSRSEWGAKKVTGVSRTTWAQRQNVTWHHSAGPTGQTIRSIQEHHMDGRGWNDIGYNFLIRMDGTIYEGRGWLGVGAHADGHNTADIGVCFLGDFRDGHDTFTQAAKDSAERLYREACERAGRHLGSRGHGEIPGQGTECPGDQVLRWIHGKDSPDDGGEKTQSRTEKIVRELPTLSRGDSGVQVTRVQTLLNVAGASPRLAADGDYGPATENAVKDLQRRGGVSVDGVVGCGETWPLLLGLRP